MGARVKLPKVGKLCRIQWLDATGFIGADISEVEPARCRTVGWLKSINEHSLILATSLYEDGVGDFTCIPLGMLIEAKEIDEK